MLLVLLTSILALNYAALGDEPKICKYGEKMPTKLQGPFVSIANGGILAVEKTEVHTSYDQGQTWESKQILDPEKYLDEDVRAIVRTREGTIIFAFMNKKEMQQGKDGWGKGSVDDWIIPCYIITSTDEGKTWSEPLQIQKRWCGALRCMIQLTSGRVVLVAQDIEPWTHVTLTYVSDDQGKTWQKSNTLRLGGFGDHAGAMEATIVERRDQSLYMLIRTTKGNFYESISTDEGLTWSEPTDSGIQNNYCCGTLCRLKDGRIALLWNQDSEIPPYNCTQITKTDKRDELAIAFSEDDAKTWSNPVVVATKYLLPHEEWGRSRVAYPWLFEIEPGTFWITTMQDGDNPLRMVIKEEDIFRLAKEQEQLKQTEKRVVFMGDTAAAYGGRMTNYTYLLKVHFKENNSNIRIVYAAKVGRTTEEAKSQFEQDVVEKKPDMLVIQFGLDDAARDIKANSPDAAPRVSESDFEANLKYFVHWAKENKIPVILMTSNTIRWCEDTVKRYGKISCDLKDQPNVNETSLARYNEITRKVAADEGVQLVDVWQMYEGFRKEEGEDAMLKYFQPGLMRPNNRAHQLIKDKLLPLIKF